MVRPKKNKFMGFELNGKDQMQIRPLLNLSSSEAKGAYIFSWGAIAKIDLSHFSAPATMRPMYGNSSGHFQTGGTALA